jgi:hypothetical protein
MMSPNVHERAGTNASSRPRPVADQPIMTLELAFLGATGTVTGSRYLLDVAG